VTLIVGILCRDGVVMASDSAATYASVGRPTIGQQAVKKIQRLNDHVLFASSGAVGMGQMICDRINTLWTNKQLGGDKTQDGVMAVLAGNVGQVVAPFLQSGRVQQQITGDASASICTSMLALPIKNVATLMTFDVNGAPERATKETPFVALGSGQAIADPFLALIRRLLWETAEPTVAEGRLAAVWAIDHVSRTHPGGVGGNVQLATLSSEQGKMPTVQVIEDPSEHLKQVSEAETALVNHLRGGKAPGAEEVAVPKA